VRSEQRFGGRSGLSCNGADGCGKSFIHPTVQFPGYGLQLSRSHTIYRSADLQRHRIGQIVGEYPRNVLEIFRDIWKRLGYHYGGVKGLWRSSRLVARLKCPGPLCTHTLCCGSNRRDERRALCQLAVDLPVLSQLMTL